MKRTLPAFLIAVLGVIVWALAQTAAPAPSMANFMPPGSLVYVEARDFAALLANWNASAEKQAWLTSDAYKVFTRSRLLLRLAEAQAEFGKAAGVPPGMDLLTSVAGGESAIGIYDIGELKFLYLTRMTSARAAETLLMKARGNYSPRSAAGTSYYVRSDPASGRTAAFAASGDVLALATDELLIASSLALLAKEPRASLAKEPWFDRAVRAPQSREDLRLVCQMAPLLRSPHFRSYWIQRNVSQLRQFESSVADLRRETGVWTERRILLRAAADSPQLAASGEAVARLTAMMPPGAGLSSIIASPSVESIMDAVRGKILAPQPGPAPQTRSAPYAGEGGGAVGSEADLEVRIDEPPLENVDGQFAPAALDRLLQSARPDGMMVVQSARDAPDQVFVRVHSAVVLAAPAAWNGAAVREALAASVESLWTTSRLGMQWTERRARSHAFQALEGIAPLYVATDGPVLAIANSEDLLASILDRTGAAPAAVEPRTIYLARFGHSAERAPFRKMMELIDHSPEEPDPQNPREPHLFSENLFSISGVLGRVDAVSIRVRDLGPSMEQTLEYRIGR